MKITIDLDTNTNCNTVSEKEVAEALKIISNKIEIGEISENTELMDGSHYFETGSGKTTGFIKFE